MTRYFISTRAFYFAGVILSLFILSLFLTVSYIAISLYEAFSGVDGKAYSSSFSPSALLTHFSSSLPHDNFHIEGQLFCGSVATT